MTMAAEKTKIIIVSKTGSLSESIVETKTEATLDELTLLLAKKCGNKKSDGFSCYHTYKYKNKNKKKTDKGTASSAAAAAPVIYVDVWCKTDGRAGQENKYELPPPIDEIIFFGNIALVARIDKQTACDLSIELWNKIYEKLFGGFEDLAATAQEDENEIDELAFVPASKKTANGYLKDGFVVDDSGSAGSSEIDIAIDDGIDDDAVATHAAAAAVAVAKKKGISGKKKSKTQTQKSDSTTTESEFITETETETDSISDSEIRSDSTNDCDDASSAPATPIATTTANRKVKPSIKKAPVAKKPAKSTKKDEMKTAASVTAASVAAAAAAVSALLDDGNDSELSEDSYSS